jgi:SIR2-like domain/MalT-like TPR region
MPKGNTPEIDWPYDFQAAEERLNLKEIERQGSFFLKRALNTDHAVAFVGSGVSAAYGRVSWGELCSLQVDAIVEVFDDFENKAEKQSDREFLSRIEPFVRLLKGLRTKVRSEDSESIRQAMQIAEQVWAMAPRHFVKGLQKRLSKENRNSPNDQSQDGAQLFRRLIMRETHDETMHVRRIFSSPFESSGEDPIEKFIAKRFPPPNLTRFHNPSKLHFIFSPESEKGDKLARKIAELATNRKISRGRHSIAAMFAGKVARLLELSSTSSGQPVVTPPIRYYAFGLAIDALRYALNERERKTLNGIVGILHDRLKPSASAVRADVVSPDDDPLRVLLDRLKIKRFVTTNYDLEIEEIFEHSGFHRTSYYAQDQLKGDQIEPVGNMGGRSREIVLQKGTGADFIDFAAGRGPYLAQVAHIHGRATDGHEIIVTERDYQRAYVGDEQAHITAREGFEILFGGNPIIFLGVGLSEDDVMRALREFAANNIRRNTSVIALRPATRSAEERDAFTLQQYIKHRVYVLHFGFLTNEDRGKNQKTAKDETRESWLEAFQGIIDDLLSLIESPPGQTPKKNTRKFKGSLDKSIGALQKQLGNGRYASDGAPCDIELELRLLKEMNEFLFKILPLWKVTKNSEDKALREIVRRAVSRTKNAVVTRALTARLQALQWDWQRWSTAWFEVPRERLADRQYKEGRVTPIHPADARELERHRRKKTKLGDALEALYATRWYRQVFVEPASIKDALEYVVESDTRARIRDRAAPKLNEGPRLFVMWGARGAGKGTLLSDLASYGDFLLQPPDDPRENGFEELPSKRYAGQFIATFSFSSEIASVWDALTAFLLNPTIKARDIADLWSDDKPGRVKQLSDALAAVKACAAKSQKRLQRVARRSDQAFEVVPRFLIVLHAFDLLFDKNKKAKNAEILRIYRTIVESGAPIDWVFICHGDKNPFSDPYGKINVPQNHGWEVKTTIEDKKKLPKSIWGNRFLSTLFLIIDADLAGPKKKIASVKSSLEQSAAARGLASADNVIDDVLAYWSERRFDPSDYKMLLDSLGARNEQWQELEEKLPPQRFRDLELAEDFNLQEVIIRHLAIISVPVDATVLAASREIRRRANELLKHSEDAARINSEAAGRQWAKVVELIQLALATLCARGLAFRFFTPYQEASSSALKTALLQRYQVHRLLQLYIYRRLGSQNFEPADAFFFSVSLYSSQTRELPTLSANAYAFLNDLVDELIDYPTPDGKDRIFPPDAETKARCLRAALGIARTLFSIGVVARFADLHEVTIPRPPRVGYFEHRRLVLRWMIVRAKALEREFGANRNTNKLMPFYRDEIVWLYNECGVFSLAQGQCFDAFALLSHALDGARKIDGEQFGPVSRRILTNLGACEINRGRLARARGWFERIYKDEKEEDETVRMIARGYLALIDHVGGSMAEAKKHYKEAIETLKMHGRSRSTSLFLCCRAELHRHLDDQKAAEDDLRTALDLSRRAGYEDMARFAIVGTARLKASNPEAKDFPTIARILDEAEVYSEAMDIPLLRCEISYTRAIILLKQGEHTRAGRETTRAIRAATLNGLALRALAYRNLLADIHIARGWTDQGKRMKEQVKEAARNVGYGLLLQRISKSSELPYENRNFAGAKEPASAGEN